MFIHWRTRISSPLTYLEKVDLFPSKYRLLYFLSLVDGHTISWEIETICRRYLIQQHVLYLSPSPPPPPRLLTIALINVKRAAGSSSFYSSAPSSWEPYDMCAVTQWSDWSHCSVTCGRGFRARTRRFYNRLGRKKCPHVDTMKMKVSSSQVAFGDEGQ